MKVSAERDEEGNVRYGRSVWRDVTDRRRAEDAIQQQYEDELSAYEDKYGKRALERATQTVPVEQITISTRGQELERVTW